MQNSLFGLIRIGVLYFALIGTMVLFLFFLVDEYSSKRTARVHASDTRRSAAVIPFRKRVDDTR